MVWNKSTNETRKARRRRYRAEGRCADCGVPSKNYYCDGCTSPRCPKKAKESARKDVIRVKNIILDHYGPVCVCCGETMREFLTLDHVNNDGNKHRKEAGVNSGSGFYRYLIKNNFECEYELQVLCYNCNNGKRCNNGICPHVTAEQTHTRT